jgi:hypothetical protein
MCLVCIQTAAIKANCWLLSFNPISFLYSCPGGSALHNIAHIHIYKRISLHICKFCETLSSVLYFLLQIPNFFRGRLHFFERNLLNHLMWYVSFVLVSLYVIKTSNSAITAIIFNTDFPFLWRFTSNYVGFEVYRAVVMKSIISWDMILYFQLIVSYCFNVSLTYAICKFPLFVPFTSSITRLKWDKTSDKTEICFVHTQKSTAIRHKKIPDDEVIAKGALIVWEQLCKQHMILGTSFTH